MNLGTNTKDIIKISKIFNNYNYEFFLVGGALRDLLLKKVPYDFDFTTNATPEEIMQLFPNNMQTGIKHGTISIIFNKKIFEITTYRIEIDYENKRSPKKIKFTKNLKEDLKRRDFTINSMAMNMLNCELIDCYNGKKDLNKKRIKCIGEPNKRFEEDALRILRAARFASTLDFTIDHNTLISMKYKKENILLLSKERINNEFIKLLEGKNPIKGVNYLQKINFFKYFFNIEINKKLKNKINLLNKNKFYLKAIVIFTIKKDIQCLIEKLKLLKFSNKDIKLIIFYRIIIDEINTLKIKNISNVRILLSKATRENYKEIFDIYKAIKGKNNKLKFIMNNIKRKKLLRDPLSLGELKINGNDIKNLNLIDNKNIGKILNHLLTEVLNNPKLNKKEILIKKIKDQYLQHF
ncbi:CCA tRNA nucleotidyltransferase [Borrelia miyamotoi]|uniref:CCA tRNA nucleotidyltransferase n=1 Tax=Borrelia miyamotoi TaxID=47466 RepID=A0AAX3JLR7_9SPIR|nr:CCA tRNA nucleotidyltransferase [Borrelia miyamotoi]QFP41669.1 CCA tRNA nucleotidyltransferase [Borrelia miyamotoi]QFP47789.1 CCA tRNA nucleotidyltransferase [Borrelia miyamotoi]QGT55549.1 polynucleotide adenylyltransferase [Borrelia miyamotoi]QGT56331.1 polynucleotide adenylyltransferase [Borrelia miyamotoi]WAZ71578.1 CCA tRNA nucleotidyltransferase [Borrelia miyamotoi]